MSLLSQLIEFNDMIESDVSFDISEIFSNNESDSESNSDLKLDSENSKNDDDLDDDLIYNKSQQFSEHYLDEAENLNVFRLQQKRYSDKTQKKLDENCEYWDK